MEVDFNPRFIPAASVKPALSGLKWDYCHATQGSAAHKPWAIQECPFRTWLGRMVFLVGTHRVSDPGLLAARRHDSLPIQIQRSGHGGPPPRHPGAGPFRMVFSVGCTLGVSDPGFLAAHSHECLPIPTQRSGHGGPRGRGLREFIDLKGTAGSASARHSPKPFPEGEIFHSLGLTRSGYPR